MAITIDDFSKIWASTSPLTPYSFSDSQYKEGWNFIGSTPPARQMWDFLQKRNDEKTQWLYNNKLSLSGGTMTGSVGTVGADNRKFYIIHDNNTTYPNYDNIDVGWNYTDGDGACISLRSASFSGTSAGEFSINARTGNASKTLNGKPDGTFTWAGNTILTKGAHIQAGKTSAITVNANGNASVNITFSPSFSSNSPVVIATVDTGYTGLFVAVGNITSSGAMLMVNNVSSTSRLVVVGWVAIDI